MVPKQTPNVGLNADETHCRTIFCIPVHTATDPLPHTALGMWYDVNHEVLKGMQY